MISTCVRLCRCFFTRQRNTGSNPFATLTFPTHLLTLRIVIDSRYEHEITGLHLRQVRYGLRQRIVHVGLIPRADEEAEIFR